MTAHAIFAVFEDFNEPREDLAAPVAEDEQPSFGDIGEIRSAAWTEGYMTGRQEAGAHDSDQPLTAKLLTSVHDLGTATAEAVDAAALTVADMLVSTVIALASDAWSAQLLDRVRMVADRIKPALTVAPEFELRDDHGAVQYFADISQLSRALDAGGTGDDVTIRWQRGEATISRMALLEDLREAIVPLSAGRVNEQNARKQT
jgi:hypothetical protein